MTGLNHECYFQTFFSTINHKTWTKNETESSISLPDPSSYDFGMLSFGGVLIILICKMLAIDYFVPLKKKIPWF